MERNLHKVPLKKWRKWSARARYVFNQLYGSMAENAWVFQHPGVASNPPKAYVWKTTAWNAAWVAADAADGHQATTEVIDINIRTWQEVGRRTLKAA